MRTSAQRQTVLVATLAVSASLTACGSGATSGGAGAPTDQPIPSLTYAVADWPSSLNGYTTKIDTSRISALVSQPLERSSYQNGVLTFTPNLATSVTQPSPTTAVFTLRGGVKFSDGTPLTAQDVAWSMTAAAAPTAETAANMQGFGNAVPSGPNEVTVTWQYPTPLQTLREVVDDFVEVQQAAFAQAHSKDLGTPGALPIGTGPYLYQSQTAQDITLVPNPHYWGVRPKAQKLVFTKITQDNSAELALRSGSVQAADLVDVRTAPQWQAIPGASLHVAHDPSISFLSLDLNTPPFNDVHVRKAIAYAVDRKSIVTAGFSGHADLLQGILPAAGFTDVAPSPDAATKFLDQLPRYDFDLAKAKSELAQSAYPHGFSTTVTYAGGQNWQQILLLSLQQNLKPLGVTITLSPVSGQQWFQTFFSHQATGLQVFPNVAILSGDVSAVLPGMVGKASMRPGMLNNANFTDPAVESAYPAIAPKTIGQHTRAEQWAATQTVLTEVAEQVPYVPLFSPQTVYVLGKGFTYTKTPAFTDMLSGSWIDYLRASA
jgi:peptide/nickel transport system substrate-binding protein